MKKKEKCNNVLYLHKIKKKFLETFLTR